MKNPLEGILSDEEYADEKAHYDTLAEERARELVPAPRRKRGPEPLYDAPLTEPEHIRAEMDTLNDIAPIIVSEPKKWPPLDNRDELTLSAWLTDMLDLAIHTAPMYGVNQTRFVMEAAQVPVFAEYLRHAKWDLCNYISNTTYTQQPPVPEPYTREKLKKLEIAVSNTLGIAPDWAYYG